MRDSRAVTTPCEHDWRVDPNVMLPSYPPQCRLVCARCGATKSSGIRAIANPSNDPATWEKWKPSEAELEGLDYWEQPPVVLSPIRWWRRRWRSVEAATVTALFAPKPAAGSESVDE